MYSESQNLGDWKTNLKKARDIVHKIFPRELSPSRLLEKYAADTKKKTAAKGAAVIAKSEAENVAADAALKKKLDALTASVVPAAPLNFSDDSVPNMSAPAPDATPNYLVVALGAGALTLLILAMRRKS